MGWQRQGTKHHTFIVTVPGHSRATVVFKRHNIQLIRFFFFFERGIHFILPLLKDIKKSDKSPNLFINSLIHYSLIHLFILLLSHILWADWELVINPC